ncbi:tol-pal system-associated acyl-CoA thioesterase [Lichenihabitans psoromatis]|uniref:tol-pal system-associated acyl-CoA thioesterase n=1 Tax=Lichenihabitans psoromatis TaxID=2528642 RepID=UPI0010369E6D|nr:tol-pal system-associated acyl-CoA thioesterase [Lichenihabitans psoromatis]
MSGAAFEAHRWSVRVYYEDTDFSGVVYHANYLRFLERGRTEFLRHLGINQADLRASPESGPMAFAVRHITLDFRAAARMDDILMVDTTIEALGGASVTMGQSIQRGEDVLVTADIRIGLVQDGRARRFPPALMARLRPDGKHLSPSIA